MLGCLRWVVCCFSLSLLLLMLIVWTVVIVALVLDLINSVVVVIYTGVYVFVYYGLLDCHLMLVLVVVIDLLWCICGLFLVTIWLCLVGEVWGFWFIVCGFGFAIVLLIVLLISLLCVVLVF